MPLNTMDLFGVNNPANFQPQGIEGNSLTRNLRAITNVLPGYGEQQQQAGNRLLQYGGDITQSGLGTMQPSIDYFSALLSGDPTRTFQAIAPTVQNLDRVYEGATRGASQLMPRGGARSATLAELPFQKAGQVSNALFGLQPGAASQLANIGTGVAGIGLGQQGVGIQEQQQALRQFQNVLQALLEGRGQDVAEHGQAMGLAGGLGGATIHGLL